MKLHVFLKQLESLKQNILPFFSKKRKNSAVLISHKDKLKGLIEEEKNKHEIEQIRLQTIELEKIYDKIRSICFLGNLDENKEVLNTMQKNFSDENIEKTKLFIQKEELKFLRKSFFIKIKNKSFIEAESMLVDIHIRTDSKDYEDCVFKLEQAKNKKTFLQKTQVFIQKLAPVSQGKKEKTEEKTEIKKSSQVLKENKIPQDSLPKNKNNLDAIIIPKDIPKDLVKDNKVPVKIPTVLNKTILGLNLDKNTEQKQSLSLQERAKKKMKHWKGVFHMMHQEYKGENVDPFLLTDKAIKKSKAIEKTTGDNTLLKNNALPEENISEFENIFGNVSEDETDILETLLSPEKRALTEKKQAEKEQQVLLKSSAKENFKLVDLDEEEEEVEYINPFLPYIQFSLNFMVFSLFLLIFSFLFFFIQLDPQNRLLNVLNQNNFFVQEETKKTELTDLKQNIKNAELGLKKIKEGSFNISAKVALDELMLQKIDWIAVREDLKKSTLQALPYNDVLKYIQYSSFKGDADEKKIQISGTIIDPSGRVFLLLTKLIYSINLNPSFKGAEINTFSKSQNGDEEVGGYMTSFSLDLIYIPDLLKVTEKEDQENK
jgi:hypothetical protein